MSELFLIIAKVFSVGLALIAMTKSYLGFRSHTESLQIFVFWMVTWSGVIVIALFPSLVDLVIANFGGGRTGLGTFFGMAIVFLFFVVYRMYLKIERLERAISKTIQEQALREDWIAKRK